MLGVPHPDHLLRVLTSKQVAEWQAFLSLEPRGDVRQDIRMARLCQAVMAAGGQGDARMDPWLLEWGEPPPPPTPEEVQDKLKSVFKSLATRGG
jgi:hypothetical protein